MDTALLNKKFEHIGARLKILDRPRRHRQSPVLLTLDIGTDRRGEFFEIAPVAGLAEGPGFRSLHQPMGVSGR